MLAWRRQSQRGTAGQEKQWKGWTKTFEVNLILFLSWEVFAVKKVINIDSAKLKRKMAILNSISNKKNNQVYEL